METLETIMAKAALLGACDKVSKVTDWEGLVKLFFSSQGREFCKTKNFPSLLTFRDIRDKVLDYGIWIDSGTIVCKDLPEVALVGDTDATLIYTDNKKVHKVVLMYGSKVHIKASSYVVVLLDNMGNCDVEIEKDASAIIL